MTRKTPLRSGRRRARAFTLIELLVSMTVLSIIVLLISQLLSSATNVATSGRRRLDADAQARLVFDRMALDLGKMVKRNDVDYLFAKLTDASGGQAKNDAMFFYSEAPAFYDDTSAAPAPKSSLALVGYRINTLFQLERLGKQLSWDGLTTSSPGPGGIMSLSVSPTPAPPATPDLNIIETKSTLAGNWPNTIGTALDVPAFTNTSDDADYQVLAEQVCRMEVCFQLKDGSYSPIPICPVPAANLPKLPSGNTPVGFYHDIKGPTVNSDSNAKYVVGSRWYDTAGFRGYVCVDNTSTAAVWKPLGMQDVQAVVVALAILDSTSSRIVPTTSVTVDSRLVYVPKLDALIGILADADPADVISPSGASAQPSPTVPLFSTPPVAGSTPVPSILMAEAWSNEIKQSNFAQKSSLPNVAAHQVRVYQRSFALNNQ